MVASCRLMHLFDPCSVSAGVALLLARLRGLPVVAAEPPGPAGLWGALDLRRLVDCIVPADTTPGELPGVYRMVLTARQEAA